MSIRIFASQLAACLALASLAGLLRAGPATQPAVLELELYDLAGAPVQLKDQPVDALAIVFLGTECPVANKSIVKLNYLSRSFAKGNWSARLYGVLSDPRIGRKQAQDWAKERAVAFPIILDTSGELAMALQPTHTPEAFVLDRTGAVVYRGRIDDTFPQLGKQKHDATRYDLAGAVTDVLHGRPVKVPRTEPVGCLFESWNLPRAQMAPVTFARDIAPIIFSNCVSCHRTGEVAPFPLSTYDDVAKRSRMIAVVTGSRYMPPWKPKAGFGQFQDERRLSDRQIELIRLWAEAGAPLGNPDDLPPPPQFPSGWRLGQPDLVLKMPHPYRVPAAGRDIYRAFVIPLNLAEDAYVAGIEFRPGAPSVVHHAIFYLDTRGVARAKDEADPLPGYLSFGGPGFLPAGALGGWA
ncbi:MAG: redoxin domain-containing protein, partial [Phycisphaerales bacterium]|nr:redoxin domain-containing protein [Phycisphaerales bacterium]